MITVVSRPPEYAKTTLSFAIIYTSYKITLELPELFRTGRFLYEYLYIKMYLYSLAMSMPNTKRFIIPVLFYAPWIKEVCGSFR